MDEQELLNRCRAGDCAAFEPIFRSHAPRAVRTAYLITRDWALAEDVAQEAFIRAFRALDAFRPGQPFGPWLYRIVVNEARRALSRAGRARTEPVGEVAAEDSSGKGPEEAVLEQERWSLLHRAVGELSEEHRTVVVLKYFNRFTEAEIATVLGIPVTTVKSRLYVARQRLMERVGTRKEGAP